MISQVKSRIKGALYRVAPRWTSAWMSARARAHSHRVVRGWGCNAIDRKLIDRFGNRVQEGPFAGVTLSPMTCAEHLGPFLLGVYESELDDTWALVRRGVYGQIVDVGAKFGFYAVGLAGWFPSSRVVAFDTDWWARDAISEMAVANGVLDRVEIHGYCDRQWITNSLRENAFVLSDCEGFEAQLFAEPIPESLRTATLLIEVHDDVVPGLSRRLQQTFDATHRTTAIEVNPTRRVSGLDLSFLSEDERRMANQEVRSMQSWLFCMPRSGPNCRLGEP